MHASAKTLARREIERQIIEDGTAIWKTKKEIEYLLAVEEKKQHWNMLATYNPWGKPGHGAPMPGAYRKTKWISELSHEALEQASAIKLGRPGHGAPLRTPSGKTKAYIKSDPLIRFQLHESARRAVENDLRYKSTPNDKENYKKELDAIICQNKKKNEEAVPGTQSDKQKQHLNTKLWSPQNILENVRFDFIFFGWTNDIMLKKIEKNCSINEREQMYEIIGGGVELVPLLARYRNVTKYPLSTTDITKMSRLCNDTPKMEAEYFKQLCTQIDEKERQKQNEEREDIKKSQKHFETWKGFWGRPGHGAPKALSQREKLEFLLYRIPFRKSNFHSSKIQ